MTRKSIILTCISCAALGIIVYAFSAHWITFHIPRSLFTQVNSGHAGAPHAVTLHYWSQGTWHTEKTLLVGSPDQEKLAEQLVGSLLKLMFELHISTRQVHVQSALMPAGQHELFISMDHMPFRAEASIFSKWMCLEGILRTLAKNGIKATNVRFLLNHKQPEERHLDLSFSWPISGFVR